MVKPTASRELDSLVRKGILERVGVTGRSTYYVLKGSRYHISERVKPMSEASQTL